MGFLGIDSKSTSSDTRTNIDSFNTNSSAVDARSYQNVGNVALTFASGGAQVPTGNPVTDTIRDIFPVAAVLLVGAAVFLMKGSK